MKTQELDSYLQLGFLSRWLSRNTLLAVGFKT